MLLLIWGQDIEESTQRWRLNCQKRGSTLNVIFDKEFSCNVDSKRSENMGVKGGLLVIGIIISWVRQFVYPSEVTSLI